MQTKKLEQRFMILSIAIILVFSSLSLRLGYLQLVRGGYYKEKSENNFKKILPLTPPRGEIRDRMGRIIASNRPGFSVSLFINEKVDRITMLGNVSQYAKLPLSTLVHDIKQRMGNSGERIVLKYKLTDEQFAAAVENRKYLSGVNLDETARTLEFTFPLDEKFAILRRIFALTDLLAVPPEEVVGRIYNQRYRLYEPVKVKSDISQDELARLEERKMEFPGVLVDVEPVREINPYRPISGEEVARYPNTFIAQHLYPGLPPAEAQKKLAEAYDKYPYHNLASHILGHVGAITAETIDEYKKMGYTGQEMVGRSGLEKNYEPYLKGTYGAREVVADSQGRPVRVLGETKPIPGGKVFLTIDSRIQMVAEVIFTETLKRESKEFPNVGKGAFVVMNPRNGAVLAMGSFPNFDPNTVAKNPNVPWLNYALQGTFSPGSTFKPLTAVAALEEKVTNTRETIYDPGYLNIAGYRMYNWVKTGHGWVNITKALAVSNNTFMGEMGRRLGIERLRDYASRFGLGQPTGIELPEAKGSLPEVEWPPEIAFDAIGQAKNSYTPIQLAVYTSALANGGDRFRPQLVEKVVDSTGKTVKEMKPEVISHVNISEETMDVVRQGMQAVTQTSAGGTASYFFQGFPIPVAAKTGTAEVQGQKYNNGLFIAYAPADDPQIAVVTVAIEGGHGSTTGAPLARAVFEEFFGLNRPQPEPDIYNPETLRYERHEFRQHSR